MSGPQPPPRNIIFFNKICSSEGKILPSPAKVDSGNAADRYPVLIDNALTFGN